MIELLIVCVGLILFYVFILLNQMPMAFVVFIFVLVFAILVQWPSKRGLKVILAFGLALIAAVVTFIEALFCMLP